MEPLSVAGLCELLVDPSAPVRVSSTLVVVRVDSAGDLVQLAESGRLGAVPGAGLPCVLAAVAATPALAEQCAFADIVTVEAEAETFLTPVAQTVATNPIAATTFALLLRSAPVGPSDADVLNGLIAESASYSTLQGGVEFQRWRSTRARRAADSPAERVVVQRADDVLNVTLNRPERRNALDAPMRDALVDALAVAMADPGLRVLITGSGPAFSAGGDLDEFGSRPDPAIAHVTRLTRSPAWLMHLLADRIEVRLHGACLGSGIELPAFAGRVVAAADTVMGLPELALGLIPGAGGTVSLPRRIGRQRTAALGLSGARIDAATALSWGLVDEVRPR